MNRSMNGFWKVRRLVLVIPLVAASALQAGDCTQTSRGLTPLVDLGPLAYHGHPGGLYASGSNQLPDAHRDAGVAIAKQVVPLDPRGQPDAAGRVALLSVGMSNTHLIFQAFEGLVASQTDVADHLVPVNGAQGGMDAVAMSDPASTYWSQVLPARLAQAGVTAEQVQVVWLMNAVAHPTAAFPRHAVELRDLLGAIVHLLHARLPNLKLVFLSSRSYAGYAASLLNPEPYAYESAFAVKWLVEQQTAGKPAYNHDPRRGPVMAPWMSWGPYTYADGMHPRGDGLVYACSDFRADGTHPSPTGALKLGQQLLTFFRSSPVTSPWFRLQVGACERAAGAERYQVGIAGDQGVPYLSTTGWPALDSRRLGLQLGGAAGGALAFLVLGQQRLSPGMIPVGDDWLYVRPDQVVPFLTDLAGQASWPEVDLRRDPSLCGTRWNAQVLVADKSARGGPFAATRPLELFLGDT